MAAGADRARRTTVTLAITGGVAWAAVMFLTLFYVNFPADVETPYGVYRHAVAFFRLIWGYPLLAFSPRTFQIAAILGLLLFWGAYLFALWTVSKVPEAEDQSSRIPVILAVAVALNLTCVLFFPPILSGDVFHYAIQGRMYAVHNLNPYTIAATNVTEDPFLPLAIWRDTATHYGPVWIQLSALCAYLGGGSPLLTVLCFKVLAGLANLFGALMVLALIRNITGRDGVIGLLFYAWNPILILESSGGAHNDAVMMAFALLGILLFSRNRLFLGMGAILASALIKYITLLLLGFALIHVLVRQSSLHRLGLAIRLGLFAALLLLVFYGPFLSGIPEPAQLVIGVSSSLNPMPNNAGLLLRHATASLLGATGLDAMLSVSSALNAVFALFAASLIPAIVRPGATFVDLLGQFGLASVVYTFLIYGGSFPWYLVSPLAALAAAPETRTTLYIRLLTIGLGIGLMLQTTILIPR
jgi:hypothetical protein